MAMQTHKDMTTRSRQVDPGCFSARLSRLSSTVHPHEASDAPTAIAETPSTTRDAGWVGSSVRLLMMRGLSSPEAGNVVACMAGLHAAEGGWTVRQIERLLALRSYVDCSRLES